MNDRYQISIIGLGYVGLSLSISFSKYYKTVGYDIDKLRISELKKSIDQNREVKIENHLKNILFTNKPGDISSSNVFIITVPTPVTKNKNPDLKPLLKATKLIARYIKSKSIVIYESTVYPGVTNDVCIPILEKISGLKCINNSNRNSNYGFHCGYSPERINPGISKYKLKNITKIISANDTKGKKIIRLLYKKIVNKVYLVDSIEIAESAKVIENIQRDVNIALMNELLPIFKKLNIDFNKILKAANTKWNFINFKPGLVGGHCISVDPYYLKFIADKIGQNSTLISSARNINNNFVNYYNNNLKKDIYKNLKNYKSKILFCGFAYKPNCPDTRNTLVYPLYKKIKKSFPNVDIYDPLVSVKDVNKEYNIKLKTKLRNRYYDCIYIIVKHKIFNKDSLKEYIKKETNIYYLQNI